MTMERPRIAVLDDYQSAARTFADWSGIDARADVTVFHDHAAGDDAVVARLESFDAVCLMRERTPMTREIMARLPRLRLICSTGPMNRSIDVDAANELGITVAHTGYSSSGAIEVTWALLLAAARHIPEETASVRSGGWQTHVGDDLDGKTLGILGLGRIGTKASAIAQAFGMRVIAWSQNLTPEKAAEHGAIYVSKDELFAQSDFVMVQLVLSGRTQGLIGAADFARMKPGAWFINTSRGPIVDEAALIDVLQRKAIAGAALDVFDTEPLPDDHPLRTLPNVVATGHIGFVTRATYTTFFGDTVRNLTNWLDSLSLSP
jgi:phosphoglycerate dehydrogenase-like enzyme